MYIDPNTGGMLFQVLATLLAVFSGMALLFSSKIRSFFARIKRSQQDKIQESGSNDSTISSDPAHKGDLDN